MTGPCFCAGLLAAGVLGAGPAPPSAPGEPPTVELRARAGEVLRSALEGRDESLLRVAVGYAPNLRGAWVVGALRQATTHNDPTLRIAALYSLVERDPASGVEALRRAVADPREDPVVRLAAAEKLPGLDPQAVPVLRRLLADPDPTLRLLAAGGLAELGDLSGLPQLEAALAGEDPGLRVDAASELLDAHLREEEALRALGDVLRGPGETIARTNAAYALGETRFPETVPLLVAALEDPDRGVRIAATSSLGLVGPRSTAVLLEVAVHDPDTAVRLEAIHGLAGRRSAEVVRGLRRGLEDAAPVVRLAAAAGLGEGASAGLEEAIGVATKAVETAGYNERLAGISALGKVGATAAARALAPHLDDPDPMTRLAAAISVHRILVDCNR